MLIGSCCLVRASRCHLWAEETPATTSPAPSTAPSSIADVVEHLNGTRWDVEWRPLYGNDSAEPLRDILTFQDGTMRSQLLTPDEFQPGRFTVTIDEHAAPTWEAAQSSQRVGVVLWRGELQGDQMHGVVSKEPVEGDSADFLFSGHRMLSEAPSAASASSPAAEPPASAPELATVGTP